MRNNVSSRRSALRALFATTFLALTLAAGTVALTSDEQQHAAQADSAWGSAKPVAPGK
ncbi:hypothetical protein [Streptomyces sp. NPDC002044]|uniref:hypothetical protein n=1 Tax=Streptomyces sp. NPDC002044 TaxID=3154662 RepID=UPI00331A6392